MVIGNLGKDPDMRYTPSGRPVTKFSLATNRSWTTQDGQRHEETQWFNIVAWGRLGETCNQYLAKGSRVYIEGRLQTRRWEDSNGNRQSMTEIVANEMLILDSRNKRSSSSEEEDDIEDYMDEEEDEFPF
jgi:single-strand DNA-binding protein